MSRLFYQVMQDNVGNLLFDVSGTMRLAGTGTLATIYGDEALTVILPNPMTNHPSFGSFKCFLGAGDYDFYMAKAGYTFETLTGVQGHGTMAQQDAANVAITGGSIAVGTFESGMLSTYGNLGVGTPAPAGPTAAGNVQINGAVGIGLPPSAGIKVYLKYDKPTQYGMILSAQGSDAGNETVVFQNTSGSFVGSIQAGATATAYNTASDVRLKRKIQELLGGVDAIKCLRPVSYVWNSTDEPDIGFLAHELMTVAPNAVQGLPDAVNPDGTIQPQQVDQSKLIPLLTSAIKELLAQVEALTERVVSLETQLGV